MGFDLFDFSFFQELSKITMPVVFNEPLTFLQRITEYLEYATLLETAAAQDNPVDRMMVRKNMISEPVPSKKFHPPDYLLSVMSYKFITSSIFFPLIFLYT